MTQPEALRLADFLEDVLHDWVCANEAAAELRRLHAENETLRDSNEAKAERIDRLGETVEKLKAQRDELINVLHSISWASQDSGSTREGIGLYARSEIAKAEGKI